MPADLAALRVSIDGTQAAEQAKQIAQNLTQMGAAGEAAAQKVAATAPKMTDAMKQASVQAAQTKGMFAELQAAMAKPITQASAVGAFAELQRSIAQMTIMEKDAGEAGKAMGGQMGAAYAEVAAQAAKAAAALAGIAAEMKEMAAAGAAPEEMMTAMAAKVAEVGAGFQKMGTMQKAALESVAASSEQVVNKTFNMSKAYQEASAAMQKAGTEARTSSTAAAEGTEKVVQSLKRVATETKAATAAIKEEGEVTRSTAQLAIRSGDDLMRVVGMGTGGKGGALVRGIEDLFFAIKQGGIGMLGLTGGMIAFSAVFKLIQAPIDALKASFAEGLGQEKLDIQMKAMLGSARAAHAELSQIKDFVTGPGGGFMAFEDAQKGVERLQMLSGGLITVSDGLKILAGAQAVSGQSAERLGQEIGKVSGMILAGAPVRFQMLEQLVSLKVISQDDAVAIENMSKKHADAHAIMTRFTQALHENDAAAKEASDSFGGLANRMDQILHKDILEPFGAALASALKGPLKDFDNWLKSEGPAIKQFANDFSDTLNGVFIFVKAHGIMGSLQEGFHELGGWIKTNWQPMGEAFWTTAFDHAKTAAQGFWQWYIGNAGTWASQFWPAFFKWVKDQKGGLWGYLWSLGAQPTTEPVRPPSPTLPGLGGGAETPGASELRQFYDQAQKEADAVKQQTDATAKQSSATDALKNANVALQSSMDLLNATMKQLPSQLAGLAFGGALGPSPVQPPFPGASRGLSEWKPGEPMTRATMFGPTGMPMGLGTIALSIDKMIELFGSEKAAIGKFVDILDAQGHILLAHQQVRDVSFLKEGVQNRNTFEVWGRSWDAWGKVVPSAPWFQQGTAAAGGGLTLQQSIDQARREREAREKADQAGKGKLPGAPPPLAGKEKGAKELSDEKKLTDELAQSEKNYAEQIKITEQQRKAHLISAQDAYAKELNIYKQEESELEQIRAKLEAAAQAATKAHDATKVEQYNNKLAEVSRRLDEIREKELELSQQTFGGQFQAELGKKIEEMQLTGTKAADTLVGSLDKVGQAFISIADGSTNAKDAVKQMVKSIADDLMNLAMKMIESQILQWFQSLASSAGGGAGGLGGLAELGVTLIGGQHGGMVYGPGGTDRVPLMLSSGEYVMSKSTVDKYGLRMIDALNRGTWGHMAGGGFVGAGSTAANVPPSANPAMGAVGTSISVNTNVTIPPSPPGQGGGQGTAVLSKEDAAKFQMAISTAVKQEIATQKRPGGLLNKSHA
jgi:hypothetical protein